MAVIAAGSNPALSYDSGILLMNSFFDNKNGFTLIELLLVLVIVATLAIIAGPDVSSGQQSAELKSAARDVASALRYTRGQALISHREAVFSIDLEKNNYHIQGKDKQFQISDDIEITLVTAQSELTGAGQGRIRFYPDGSSSGGRVTLEIAQRKREVDVNWLTGHIEITND